MDSKKLIIGISSCLLGEKVRYDGNSKRDDTLIRKLHRIVLLLPICPEVEIGMTVPRERLRLEGSLDNIKMIAEKSQKDWTDAMLKFSSKRILLDDFREISGLILKSKSPSCGIKSTEIFNSGMLVSEQGEGLFASVVAKIYPLLPIIDELSLRDSQNFESFIKRVSEFSHSRY